MIPACHENIPGRGGLAFGALRAAVRVDGAPASSQNWEHWGLRNKIAT